jgi:hypothetical protein
VLISKRPVAGELKATEVFDVLLKHVFPDDA